MTKGDVIQREATEAPLRDAKKGYIHKDAEKGGIPAHKGCTNLCSQGNHVHDSGFGVSQAKN
jgi:hypothetical protein